MAENKIEDLTAEQEAKLDVYAEEFTKAGLSLAPIDHTKAEAAFASAYELQKMEVPKAVEWLPSPFAMLARGAELEMIQALVAEGKPQAEAEKISHEMFDTSKTLSEEAQTKITDLLGSCCFGQHESGWLSWVDFFRREVGLKAETDEMAAIIETAKSTHWWLPFENAVLASERPIEMYLGEEDAQGNRLLHKDGGPSIRYTDGFCLWNLNGVDVPQWLAEKAADKLSPEKILKLANAEQRKEGIRKIGIDRLREPLKVQVLDTWKDYELWTIEFEGRRIGPYLKMVNDSTKQIHVEGVGEVTDNGVDPKIKTCKEALAWRGGFDKYEEPGWTA